MQIKKEPDKTDRNNNSKEKIRNIKKLNDSDEEWLIHKAHNIIKSNIRTWMLQWSFVAIYLVIAGLYFYYSLSNATFYSQIIIIISFCIIIIGIFLLLIAIVPLISKTISTNEIKELFKWNDFFHKYQLKTENNDKTGRIESIMKVINLIEKWSIINSNLQTIFAIIMLLLGFFLLLNYIPRGFRMIFIMYFFGLLIINNIIFRYLHLRRMKLWRPRLDLYKKRIEIFWETL